MVVPSALGNGRSASPLSITGLVEGWWLEGKSRGLKLSTYESYRYTAAALSAFLQHDDAARSLPKMS